MSIEFIRSSTSPRETHVIGAAIGRLLTARDAVLLEGDLGAGKTALVRGIAEGMGLDPSVVSSPTFVILHQHIHPSGGVSLTHMDAYRLAPEDADSLGLERALAANTALVVEWPARLPPALLDGLSSATIRLEATGEQSRDLVFALPDSWSTRPGLADLRQRGPTTCPVTGRPVPADCPTYPFADERARGADLYRWFAGSHTISRPVEQSDLEQD